VGDQLTIKGEKRSEAHQIMLAQIGAHRRKPESLALPFSLANPFREPNHKTEKNGEGPYWRS
jgi:hypothetical protein